MGVFMVVANNIHSGSHVPLKSEELQQEELQASAPRHVGTPAQDLEGVLIRAHQGRDAPAAGSPEMPQSSWMLSLLT